MGANTEIAKRLYLEGKAAYDKNDFGVALEKYQTAYSHDPRPGLLFNMSQIYRNIGDRRSQAVLLERYIEQEPESKWAPAAQKVIENFNVDSEADARNAMEPKSVRDSAADAFEKAKRAYADGDIETAKAMFAVANRIAPHPRTQRALDEVSAPQQQPPMEAPQPFPQEPQPGPGPQEQMMRAATPQQAAQAFMAQPEPDNWWDYAGQPGPVQPMPDDYQAVMSEIDRPAAPEMPADYQAVLAQLDPARGRGGY